MTSTGARGLCTVCDKSGTSLCKRCKSVRYCSKACQEAGWPIHKLLCAAFSGFDTSSRPTSEHFRAIFFPVNDEKPKPVWLHCKWHDDEEDGKFQLAECESFLGHDGSPKHAPIQHNPVLKRVLSNTIYVCHRDTFLIDGSKTNNSVASIIATKPGQYHDWRGPIIAYGKEGLGTDQIACKDLDMRDFRHVADYFLSYGYTPPPTTTQQPTGAKVKGVKINCLGDQKMLGKSHFEAVEVPTTDPIFFEHDTSDIAQRVGLPIYTRRCPSNPEWARNQNNEILGHQSPFNNQDATFLHLCCDPKADFDSHYTRTIGWAWAPRQWQNNVGSAIVVRQDRKTLSPWHVEALSRYCRIEISPLLAHSIGEYAPRSR